MSGTVSRLGFGWACLQSAGTSYLLFAAGVLLLWCPPVALSLWAAAATDFLVEPLLYRGEPVADCPRCRRTTRFGRADCNEYWCRRCGSRFRMVAGQLYAF